MKKLNNTWCSLSDFEELKKFVTTYSMEVGHVRALLDGVYVGPGQPSSNRLKCCHANFDVP